MRKLIVSEFITLDGVIQSPGGEDEDRDGGFAHGGWTRPYWHDDIGGAFGSLMKDTDALLLGRRTYVTHARAFEPMPAGDMFGDMMNAPAKYVVSKTLETPIWRNTVIIREDVVGAVGKLKAEPGKNILTDGSSRLVTALLASDLVDELHLLLFPVILGGGKRIFADGADGPDGPGGTVGAGTEGALRRFTLLEATPYPTGVVGLLYRRQRA